MIEFKVGDRVKHKSLGLGTVVPRGGYGELVFVRYDDYQSYRSDDDHHTPHFGIIELITEDQFKEKMNPAKELTIGQLEDLLGYKIKVGYRVKHKSLGAGTVTHVTEFWVSVRFDGYDYWSSTDKHSFSIFTEELTELITEETTKGNQEMINKFVTTETKKVIKESIDVLGPCSALMSIVPSKDFDEVKIVIGSFYRDRNSCYFDKRSLGELISILQEVQEAVEG